MKIALIQSNPVTGALRRNMDWLMSAARQAANMGADLCIAPEMALCGRNIGDFLLRSGFAAQCRSVLDSAAAELWRTKDMPPLLLGAPVANTVPEGKNLQNCAVLLHEGRVRVVGRKVLLPSEGVDEDTRYFEPGVGCGALYIKGRRIAVTVGEDIWKAQTFWQERRNIDGNPVAAFIAAGGADAIVNISALAYAQGRPALYERTLCRLAAHYRVPVAVANLSGGNDALVYYGGSMASSANGVLLARAAMFAEELLLLDLDGREKGPIALGLDSMEEIWQAIVLGTRDFVRKCGFSRVVLGLSGGVDSSLVAAIAAEAFGPEQVTGLIMPSPYSSEGSVTDALALAHSLGIEAHILPIDDILAACERSFAASFSNGLKGLAEENTQARIRCDLLMAYANRFGALLLATGNKSEAAVGYATLYGDLAGAIAPIGDLYKHQVYALCRWRNMLRPGSLPEAVLSKEPSAELAPGQKDSDSLPPYDLLDAMLFHIIEGGENLAQLIDRGYDEELARSIVRMVEKAEFKRRQAPFALQLSTRAFGGGLRIPIAVADSQC
ncbi:NAD+ synthase [Desulfovibrio sp. OttesenSCG-928-A18]|nr:NAD+ synthase [Desulfovibrio sp. OttesenSCG-928-A18]